jgi:outer membrane immunogenic protein
MKSLRKPVLVVVAAMSAAISTGVTAQTPPSNSWTGPYAGLVGGIDQASAHFALPEDTADVLVTDRDRNWKWSGGLVAGFDYETGGGVVVGLEGDVTAGKNRLAVTACTSADGCWTPAHDSFTTINHLTTRARGHLRAKVGLASGPNLFYAAGGYSVERGRLDLLGECFNPGNPGTPLLFTFSRSKSMSGFNLGGGYERRIGPHFAVRAEYLYDDFGHQLFRGDGAEWNDRRIVVRTSTFRVGADLRF